MTEEKRKLVMELTPSQMGILMGLKLRAEADATPKMKADLDEMFAQIKPLPETESRAGRLYMSINDMIWIGDSLLDSFLAPYKDKEVKIEVSEL